MRPERALIVILLIVPLVVAFIGVPARSAVASDADPSTAVERFYGLVAERDYGSAAELWSPRMRATFPPGENINQRFSQTQSLVVQRADVISQDPQSGSAAVAVDV